MGFAFCLLMPLKQERLQQHEMRLQGLLSALQVASSEKVQLQEQLEEEKAASQAAITEKLELQACANNTWFTGVWGHKCIHGCIEIGGSDMGSP